MIFDLPEDQPPGGRRPTPFSDAIFCGPMDHGLMVLSSDFIVLAYVA